MGHTFCILYVHRTFFMSRLNLVKNMVGTFEFFTIFAIFFYIVFAHFELNMSCSIFLSCNINGPAVLRNFNFKYYSLIFAKNRKIYLLKC